RLDPPLLHVELVQEHDHAAAEDAAIAIVEAVDRRVVLVVAAQRGEPQHRGTVGLAVLAKDQWIFRDPFMQPEVGRAGRRIPHQLARRIRKVESARLAYAGVVVAEWNRKDLLDAMADQVVIRLERTPLDAVGRQRRSGDAADDRDFGLQVLAWRTREPGR